MGLALIQVERLQDGLNVFIGELNENYELYNKQIDFLNQIVNQSHTAKKSKQNPEIWNQNKATQNTNCSESDYNMSSNIPKFHPLVSKITDYFKEQDAIASDTFLKLNNNFISSQIKSSKNQKEFNYFLALTDE